MFLYCFENCMTSHKIQMAWNIHKRLYDSNQVCCQHASRSVNGTAPVPRVLHQRPLPFYGTGAFPTFPYRTGSDCANSSLSRH